VQAESPAAWVDFLSRTVGPLALAKRALEPEDRWAPLAADLVALFERNNEATDGSMRARPEYLLTVVRR
jgi:hypothetical protein